MSSASNTSNTIPTLPNFEPLFEAALATYTRRTGKDLQNHPLAAAIDRCQSPDEILAIFKEQSQAFDEFRNGDPKLIKWLTPIVNGLHAISTSAATSAGASLAFPPSKPILAGIGVLLSTAKYVRASYDALVDIFDCIENFLSRLMIYTEIQPTPAMTEMIIKIMVELLGVLALATKQINQGRLKKYARKLLGEKDIESVLQRLDRLTLEESKVTIAQTLDVVYGLVKNMEVVMEDGKASIDDIQQTLVLMQELAMKVNKMERDRFREVVRRWLSAPDPWTNHNVARKMYHRGTATWFTQGDVFGKWILTGRLLWIHGLPGSGKTVLSSSIIEEVHNKCQTGLATISLFYFDFRDGGKQDVSHLLSSILVQLCDQSVQYHEILSTLFTEHGHGSRQPSEDALMECLKSMFKLPGQGALYLIIDALDECSNSSGYPTQREQALVVMQELINLQLSHVYFCITSRPEIDIRAILEPLATYNVPLHEQAGQNQDILDYINHFIRSDPMVRRWREEDKQLVIETLTRKAGGMFRWVHCQIETLRFCFPPSIRRVLNELPETLDATYERTLLGINKQTWDYAHRLFQCLVISIRPLHVKEIAELFAILPIQHTTPGYNFGWRPENPEEFILSTCSTLVSIVDIGGEKVVQFSHFSVREYLTSARIANSAPVSHFHILPKPAHTVLARACLSALHRLDYSIDRTKIQHSPLALYVAQYWVDHARFEDVSSDIRDGMDRLFDRNKPHLAVWVWLYDVENSRSRNPLSPRPAQLDAVPLYYAVLCGFHDLSERLLDSHPQDVNAWGMNHHTPLHTAAYKGRLDLVVLLLERGADVESRDHQGQTAIYVASSRGHIEVVRSLIERGADVNAECNGNFVGAKRTPLLQVVSGNGSLEIARALLEHGADVNYQDACGVSGLCMALHHPSTDFAQLLLDHGANPNTSAGIRRGSVLHEASFDGRVAFVTLLLDYGANVNILNNLGWTPLHYTAIHGDSKPEVMQVLLDHGADVNAQTGNYLTALHLAAATGYPQVVEVLLGRGADPHSRTNEGETPFQLASKWHGHTQIMRLLSERTGEDMSMELVNRHGVGFGGNSSHPSACRIA